MLFMHGRMRVAQCRARALAGKYPNEVLFFAIKFGYSFMRETPHMETIKHVYARPQDGGRRKLACYA